jgi:hypothetical protein
LGLEFFFGDSAAMRVNELLAESRLPIPNEKIPILFKKSLLFIYSPMWKFEVGFADRIANGFCLHHKYSATVEYY